MRLTEVVCVRLPAVSVMVIVEFPTGVPLVVLIVSVEVPVPPVTGEGANEQLAPVGSPAEQLRATSLVKPLDGVTVTIEVVLLPGVTTAGVEAVTAKSGAA